MVILSTSTDEQSFNCIPRGAFDTMVITDEQENTSETVVILSTTYGDYVTNVSAEFNLVEGRFYTLTLLDGANVMFKDKIFCTDKPLVNFSVNKGQYITNTTSNTYIVYE